MMIEMRKDGRTVPQYAVSERDYKWLISDGWKPYEPPIAPTIVGTTELIEQKPRGPGRPKKAK